MQSRFPSLSLSKTYLSTTNTTRPRLLSFRHLSTPSHNGGETSEETTTTDPLLRKLEEVIHRLIVKKSAPDWLPFVPGASYWVPPTRASKKGEGIADIVEKLANPLTYEESLSLSTSRGWPSSDFYIRGDPPNLVQEKDMLSKDVVDDKSPRKPKTEEEGG